MTIYPQTNQRTQSKEIRQMEDRAEKLLKQEELESAVKSQRERLAFSEDAAQMRAFAEGFEAASKRPQVLTMPKEPAKPKTMARPTFRETFSAAVGAHIVQRATQKSPDAFIAEVFPGEENRLKRTTAAQVLKSATATGTTTDALFAATLVRSDTIDYFDPANLTTFSPRLMKMARTIPFNGANSVTVPRRNEDHKIYGAFIAEGATIPVKAAAFGSSTINRNKLGVITPFTNELLRTSSPAISDLLEDAIINDSAEAIDGFLIDANPAVAGVRPAGLLNGITPQASAGVTVDNIYEDLKYLLGIAIRARARKPVILINPLRIASLSLTTTTGTGINPFKDDLDKGILGGIPFIAANTVPETTLIVLDADSLFLALDFPEIDLSNHATLVMIDDDGVAPTMADTDGVTVAGSVTVGEAPTTIPPSPTSSMFQQNAVALRFIQPITWMLARPGTVGQIANANW